MRLFRGSSFRILLLQYIAIGKFSQYIISIGRQNPLGHKKTACFLKQAVFTSFKQNYLIDSKTSLQ